MSVRWVLRVTYQLYNTDVYADTYINKTHTKAPLTNNIVQECFVENGKILCHKDSMISYLI